MFCVNHLVDSYGNHFVTVVKDVVRILYYKLTLRKVGFEEASPPQKSSFPHTVRGERKVLGGHAALQAFRFYATA